MSTKAWHSIDYILENLQDLFDSGKFFEIVYKRGLFLLALGEIYSFSPLEKSLITSIWRW